MDRFIKPVAFVIISFRVIASCTARTAPGDEDQECLTSPDRPSAINQEILMSTFNYQSLLEDDGGPWIVVDEDENNDKNSSNTTSITTVRYTYVAKSGWY